MLGFRANQWIRPAAAVWLAGCVVIAAGATPQTMTPPCDAIGPLVAASPRVPAGTRNFLSLLTRGESPVVQLASRDSKNVNLDRDSAADTRIQFEKRFRAKFGAAEALIKDLRNWEDFDVMTLSGSDVHMVQTVEGEDLCERRIFFRTTPIREAHRLPDPPVDAICQNRGAWGFLARVSSSDAFVEYRTADGRESFRFVPLVDDRWGTPCTFKPNGAGGL